MKWRIAALKNGMQDAIAYRWDYLFEILGSAFLPALLQWVLWYSIFILGGATEIGGSSYSELLQYTWLSLLFSQVRGGNHDFRLAELVRSGDLSQYLLKPVSVIEFVYLQGVGSKLFTVILMTIVGILAARGIQTKLLLVAMAVAFLGNIIHYLVGALLAAVAFKWEDAYSILMAKNLVVSLLSGELLPLHLFPVHVQWITKVTPFHLYVYAPVRIAQGQVAPLEILSMVYTAFAWIAGLAIAVHFAWRAGSRHYSAVGG